jgi:hypothetical protein
MLAKLRAQHKRIAQLHVAGVRSHVIAAEVEMAQTTVALILKDALCVAYMDTLQDKAETVVIDVRKRLANMNSAALDVIENLLTDEKAPLNLAHNAAKDVLDRTGFKAPDNINMIHTYMDKDEILAMKKRAVDAGAQLTPTDFFPNMPSTERAHCDPDEAIPDDHNQE